MRTWCLSCGLVIALGSASPALNPGSAPAAGTRTVLLVRHGLYDDADPRDERVGKGLTADGMEQARLTGARLAGLPLKVTSLRASTYTRARETARIISEALGIPAQPDSALCECTPPTDREDLRRQESAEELVACGNRLDQVFETSFRSTAGEDSLEVLVCHGNVIRYLACRVMGVDSLRWARLGIAHCSVTEIQIFSDGRRRLMGFADRGHLPPRLQTFALPRKSPGSGSR